MYNIQVKILVFIRAKTYPNLRFPKSIFKWVVVCDYGEVSKIFGKIGFSRDLDRKRRGFSSDIFLEFDALSFHPKTSQKRHHMRKFCQQGNDGGQNRKAFFEFSRNWTPDLLIINLRRIRCLFRILKNIFRKTSYTRDMTKKIIIRKI